MATGGPQDSTKRQQRASTKETDSQHSDDSNCPADGIYGTSSSSSGSTSDLRDPQNDSQNDTRSPHKIALMLKKIKDLKVCEWNNAKAHIVYSALNVKRFYVDEEHILYPLGGPTVKQILELCDQPEVEPASDNRNESGEYEWEYEEGMPVPRPQASWVQFLPKMNRILQVFKCDGYQHILDGLTDEAALGTAATALRSNIQFLEVNRPKRDYDISWQETAFHHNIKVLLRTLKSCHRNHRNPREGIFEAYVSQLVAMLRSIGQVDIELHKSTLHCQYELDMPSLEKVPQPDFYVSNLSGNILAVVEVKNAKGQCHTSHKGHRTKSYKERQKSSLACHGYVNEEVAHDTQAEMKKCEDPEKEDESNEDQDEHDIDIFDTQECQLEELQKGTLPNHIRHLDYIEKKQVRSFLPQLLAQMLACTVVKGECIHRLQEPYITQVMGIGVVGLQAQFVMLVLKDADKKIFDPTAADIEKNNSVRPYVYVTRKLNLFKQSHLAIFFRILFALSSLRNSDYA